MKSMNIYLYTVRHFQIVVLEKAESFFNHTFSALHKQKMH